MSEVLAAMVKKLDERPEGHSGYVTTVPEIIEILGALTPLTPAVVLDGLSAGQDVNVSIRVGFTVGRDEL
jgi:hypothetical protein